MHQSPRAAAVACRKTLKATAVDCYDFTEVEAESWTPDSPKTRPSASASADRHTPAASSGLRIEITCGSRESRHSRHSRKIISY
jgi:hypothetical protein